MAEGGVTLVVSGFGSKREAAAGGRVIAAVTNGTAVPEVIQLVRPNRRLVFGGHCRVRTTAAASLHHVLPIGATAVSTATSICARPPNVRRRVVNVTLLRKRRTGTVNLVGAALSDQTVSRSSSRPLGRTARPNVGSVTTRLERLSGIASRVGAALKEKYSRPRGVSASAAVVNATIQRTKRAHTANLVGAALMAKNLSK